MNHVELNRHSGGVWVFYRGLMWSTSRSAFIMPTGLAFIGSISPAGAPLLRRLRLAAWPVGSLPASVRLFAPLWAMANPGPLIGPSARWRVGAGVCHALALAPRALGFAAGAGLRPHS